MPLLLLSHPFGETTFGLWQIEEDEAFFRRNLTLDEEEEAELERFKGLRRLESLAGRWLLHRLTGSDERFPLAKDAFSKPFFVEKPDLYCSLSHSHGVVGALVARSNCGCDIQVEVDKMPRLATKFINIAEAAFVQAQPEEQRLALQHLFWTAKESLYKAYGLKQLDFRAHLLVDPFVWCGRQSESKGRVVKGVQRQDYRLWFETLGLPGGETLYWTVCVPVMPA
jgi:phosphopantetheinyl transferase